MKKIKILSMPVDDGGCGHYRIRQPAEMINTYTDSEMHIINKEKDNLLALVQALAVADVITCRQGTPIQLVKPQFENAVEKIGKEMTAKWVYDIDDNIEDISPYNYHYKDNGVEEYYDKNQKKWLWKDGQAGFNLNHNKEKLKQHKYNMEMADLITVTTPILADYAKTYNENVAVLENLINSKRWWRLRLKKNSVPRVGWSGGISHYEDWYSIEKPLNDLIKNNKFKLVMAGSNFPGIFKDKKRVEVHDWVPFKGHSYRMMCLALDMAIIPLADLPFNHYKSAIKLLEFSSMGIPCLVADVPPYSDMKGEIEAMYYTDEKDFYQKAQKLLDSPAMRANMGKKAMKQVKKNYNAQKRAKEWVQAYASIL